MSNEIIPNGYRNEFDLFADINHEKICEYAEYKIGNFSSVPEYLSHRYRVEVKSYEGFIERMVNEARYLEPVDEHLQPLDSEVPNVRTFCSGLMLATTALDVLAGELDVKSSEWRKRWQGARPFVDLGHVKTEDITPRHYIYNGGKMITAGKQAFAELEDPYKDLFHESNYLKHDDSYTEIYQASYGLLTRLGQKVLYSFTVNERLDAAVEEFTQGFSPENELTHLIPKRERRALRRKLRADHHNRHSSSQ